VTAPLDAGCALRDGDSPPTPVSGGPAWPGDEEFKSCPCPFGDCDSGSHIDAGSGNDAGSGADSGRSVPDAGSSSNTIIVSGCGCSSVHSVFFFDGSVFLLSLALLGRRRWRARPRS
jgi:hypothetical protein